jgi:4-hydroxy-4-methyl-2-oxoglutarate aldolase
MIGARGNLVTGTRTALPAEVLDAISQFDTCTIANAIETFSVRLRNEGYTTPGLQCVTGGFPRILGYAATARVRSSDPPVTGVAYLDRTDWWSGIRTVPAPRIAAIEAIEVESGFGSVVGAVHAAVLGALQCRGVITNGTVRDIPAVARMQFPMFARGAAVSHAYSHIVDYSQPVHIFGLEIRPGDLLLADCHGVVSIPHQIAAQLPETAARIRAREQRLIELCQSPGFSPEKLLEAIHRAD